MYPQTLDVMRTRAEYFGFELVVGDFQSSPLRAIISARCCQYLGNTAMWPI